MMIKLQINDKTVIFEPEDGFIPFCVLNKFYDYVFVASRFLRYFPSLQLEVVSKLLFKIVLLILLIAVLIL